VNLNQVAVPVTDVERSVEFYRRLGLVLIVKSLPNYARLECSDGGATFSLYRVDQKPGDPGVIVYFECVDVDETVRRLRDNGMRFEGDPQDQPWLWRETYLRDPDGNQICLYHAGQNRRFPPWRLAGDDPLEE
jgi:catechol 2,3-dioxygenase-like lactoylglutathione lyase family enzyme